MTTRKSAKVIGKGTLLRSLSRRAAERDALAEPRRKNFELDQHRIDLVKEALQAKTETEALTRAMDIALEMSAFAAEVRRGSERLLGKGGFVNRFDDAASLDFSGFGGESAAGEVGRRKAATRR